jgi:hypothetical protein
MDIRQLNRMCATFQARLRAALLRVGLSRIVILALVLLPILLIVDWWVHLSTLWRCVNLVLYLGLLGSAAWWTVLRPMSQRWDMRETLFYLDSVAPPREGMLLELRELLDAQDIQELDSDRGRAFASEATEQIGAVLAQARRAEAFQKERIRRWLVSTLVVVVAFAIVSIPLASHVRIGCTRLFNPFSTLRWPHRTTIALAEPERGWTIPQMESLTIKGTVTGVRPAHVTFSYRDKSTGYSIREKITVLEDGTFRYTFPEVREPLTFYVKGGDYITDRYTVAIVRRPYLKRIVAHYDYPTYAGIPDRTIESGQLNGLEGTTVRLEFESSMDLEKALFVQDDKEPEALRKVSPTQFEKVILLEKDGLYRIELYEQHGYREPKPEVYDIRVTPDNLPEIEILSPGKDMVATRRASVDIAFRCSDDFGLAKVSFFYRVDDEEPSELSDKVTGPISQRGKSSEGRFTWQLRKTDLPKSATVRYFVRVQDINPTGRGLVESTPFEIKLVKASEFHLDAIEAAKRLDAEARIAWENQLRAWKLGRDWVAKGTGKEDDALWQEMLDRQRLSFRAGKAMRMHLQDLTAKYEQNDMAREFMAVRLGVVAENLAKVTESFHPSIDTSMRGAKPRTVADAVEATLKKTRASAQGKFAGQQKLAVLHLERCLKKLFDWRDLQITTVRSTLLHEEQGEVMELTEGIAPKFIGAEIEDLDDADVDKLLTLGKRQQTILDVESELESQLVFMKSKAWQQQRTSIRAPLDTAYAALRSNRVNDNLKRAAKLINNNQPYQIIANQKSALHALDIVRGGLVVAGQKVDKDEPIVLSMVPVETLGDVLKPKPADPTEETDPTDPDMPATRQLSADELLAALPMGSDKLTMALNIAYELQDSANARTKYLHENSSDKEMPRYVDLKQMILLDFQERALRAVELATAEAKPVAPVQDMLRETATELQQSRQLIEKRVLAEGVQQLQADTTATLRDMAQFLAVHKMVEDAAEENRRREGKDAFGRQFLVHDRDLDILLKIAADLNHASLLQNDAVRKLERFQDAEIGNPLLKKIESLNRERTQKALQSVAALAKDAVGQVKALSKDVQTKAGAMGLGQVATLKDSGFKAGAPVTPETVLFTKELASFVAQSIQNIRTLLAERIMTEEEMLAKQPQEFEQITAEEFEQMRDAKTIRERLADDKSLPPEIRETMLRSLNREFPPEYKDLLSAYFASFVPTEKKKK